MRQDEKIGFVIAEDERGLRLVVNAWQTFDSVEFANGTSQDFESLRYLRTCAGQDAVFGGEDRDDRNVIIIPAVGVVLRVVERFGKI